MNNLLSKEYSHWIKELKERVRLLQIKSAVAVNKSLIEFYFELGKSLYSKENIWGSKLIERTSKDLKDTFPNIKGFSITNLKYCKRFYLFYKNEISQQRVDQFKETLIFNIPWGHNIHIFTKAKCFDEAIFYITETIENSWSRDVLALQIKSNLYKRQGKAITNFEKTLPALQSDLANQTIKDPYIFDFMSMTKPYNERDIENQLVNHITKFLLELGKGFAFVGRQYKVQVSKNDYYLDLLFYHIKLKCYVVIELKNTKFIPEYAGKLNFYLSAVDSLVKSEEDNPTIGILLCRDKDNIEVEFALRDINKPMGVSEFTLTEIVPENLKSSLPTIEEIENSL